MEVVRAQRRNPLGRDVGVDAFHSGCAVSHDEVTQDFLDAVAVHARFAAVTAGIRQECGVAPGRMGQHARARPWAFLPRAGRLATARLSPEPGCGLRCALRCGYQPVAAGLKIHAAWPDRRWRAPLRDVRAKMTPTRRLRGARGRSAGAVMPSCTVPSDRAGTTLRPKLCRGAGRGGSGAIRGRSWCGPPHGGLAAAPSTTNAFRPATKPPSTRP